MNLFVQDWMNHKKKQYYVSQLSEWSFFTLAKVYMAKNAICKLKFVKAEGFKLTDTLMYSANICHGLSLTNKHGQGYPNAKIFLIVDGQSF